jgi:RNA polymerase sigma-70 factor (sigma-E family)
VAERSTALLRTACLLCAGDVATGEDLLQDALVEVFKRWSSIREPASREAYVRRVLVRLASRQWRRRADRQARSLRLVDTSDPAQPDSALALDIRRALLALPMEQRAVIVLRYFEDMTEAQIAAVMQCPPGTVKSRAAIALKKMADLVEERADSRSGGRKPE